MAHAAIVLYHVNMNGANAVPPNLSLGTGSGTITFDTTLVTMNINVNFSGLTGNTTASAASIHAATLNPFTGTAVVATQTPTFTGFPTGVTNGTYSNTFDMSLSSSYSAGYITANGGTTATAFNALLAAAASNRAYFNIRTTSFAAGEIRGFLVAVPEPSSMCLLGVAGLGTVLAQYRRRRAKKGTE